MIKTNTNYFMLKNIVNNKGKGKSHIKKLN